MNYDWLDKAFLRLETRILRGASVDIGDVRQTKAAILQGFKELPSMQMEQRPAIDELARVPGLKLDREAGDIVVAAQNRLRQQLLRELEL